MQTSPAFPAILKRIRFGLNTLAISVSLLGTIVTACLNNETRTQASALVALGFFACFVFLWSFVREDIEERETLADHDR